MIIAVWSVADIRSVAQLGSASGLGPEGRGFESLHSDHYNETHLYDIRLLYIFCALYM